jgi:RNA-directed DNA polymerase
MTSAATLSLGASSTSANWDAIDWQPLEVNVRRLQMRIAEAAREGRWGKVKALQWLLAHSFSAKLLAVRRVKDVVTGSDRGPSKGLSRVKGNFHARFLGDCDTKSLMCLL